MTQIEKIIGFINGSFSLSDLDSFLTEGGYETSLSMDEVNNKTLIVHLEEDYFFRSENGHLLVSNENGSFYKEI